MKDTQNIFTKAVVLLFFIFLTFVITDVLSAVRDIRTIASEARDTLNVQNCYMMNDNEESFNNCLNNY